MSGVELFIDDVDGRLHAAAVDKRGLTDLYVDGTNTAGSWSSMYLGKVVKIDKSLDAAIVDLGSGLKGILPAKHVHFPGSDKAADRSGIADLLDSGQTVMVQIKSEGRKASLYENHKLPRLTMKLHIFGHYLIYTPIAGRVTVLRKISDEKLLAAAAHLKGQGAWILQPAAQHADEKMIEAEAGILAREWQELHAAMDNGDNTPRLIKPGPDALVRALTDHGTAAFDHIYAGNKKIFDMVVAWSDRFDPPLSSSKRLRLFKPEKFQQKMFEIHDIFGQIEALAENTVPLDNGGSIIIEPTSALTVIDVNQGAADNHVEANQSAAYEIARQIRLRGISGAILVDFINMTRKSDRFRLVETLEQALAGDHCGAQAHGFTRLGIIEITRKRRTGTLTEKMAVSLGKS